MSFNLVQWWHDLIDHLFKHPAAAEVAHPAIAAVATTLQPANPTVTIPGAQGTPGFQLDAGMARILGVNQQSTDILNSRVGQSAPQGDVDPNTVYYDHNKTLIYGPGPVTVKLEQPVKPGTKLSLSYTSQVSEDIKGPSRARINDSPALDAPDALQTGVEALWPVSGETATVSLDTNGRVKAQLRVI